MPFQHHVQFMPVLAVYTVLRLIVQSAAEPDPKAIFFAYPPQGIPEINMLMVTM